LDIIQLLPDHVASQIAAGEVIQRPASAVKEMLENALDAGANTIQLYVKNAGKILLQVVDDGCGMSKKDVKMCFERHATSKINSADDLFAIKTMGFRGEAMASIAAIAHVQINTKLTDNELGTHLTIEGSEIKKQEECVCANGTSIKIKNLFYNVPARRKFLKSDKVEMRHITEEFSRIALANPSIKMQLFHNDNEIFHLAKSNFRQRIVSIIGGKKNEALVPVEEETSVVKIKGFIGKPEAAKRTRGEQYFFVNGRFIKNHYLHHAVSKAFEGLIPTHYFPSYFINLHIDPTLIDINIHPTKTEIKFEDEKVIYAIIRASVKRSLGAYNIAPSLDFSQELSFNIGYTQAKTTILKEPQIKIDNAYNPFESKEIDLQKDTIVEQSKIHAFKKEIAVDILPPNAIQIGKQFIAFTSDEGLLLMHQSRAHKRILFEYFNNVISNSKAHSQQLLFPKILTLNNKDIALIMELKESLYSVGFLFNKVDEQSISIVGIPPECKEENLQFVMEHLIEQSKNNDNLQTEQNQQLAKSLANSLAISTNKTLTKDEMIALKTELLKCKNPSICPQGLRTIINLKNSDLEKYF
jgi:DNA mismatch repair protein MutL